MSSIQPQTDKSHSQPRYRTMVAAIVVLSTLVGGVFRFWNLSARDFWFDEACTYIYVKNLLDWHGSRSLLVESTNLPYYILLKSWVSFFGNSEAYYRSLSAVAATLTVPMLALIAYRLGGLRVLVVTSLVATFHPLHIYYASEARAYALWVMLLTLALWLLICAVRSTSWRWWGAYAAVVLFAAFTHYFTLFWIPASASVVLVARNQRRALSQWASATAIVGLAFVPYFIFAVLPAAGGGQAWIADHFSPIGALLQTTWALMPAGHYPAHLRGLSLDSPDTTQVTYSPVTLIVAIVPAMVILAVGLALLRQRRGDRASHEYQVTSIQPRAVLVTTTGTDLNVCLHGEISLRKIIVVLVSLTVVPLLLALAYSIIIRPIYLPGRYDLVAWPSFVLLISFILAQSPGIVGLRQLGSHTRRTLGWSVIVLVLACSTAVIAQYARFRPPPIVHHRRADVLAKVSQPGDLVVAFNYDRAGMLYYLDRAQFQGTIISFPSWLDNQIGWVDNRSDLSTERRIAASQNAMAIAGQMRKVVDAGHRVFMLVDTVDPQRQSLRVPLDDLLLESALGQGLSPVLVDEDLLIFEWKHASD